MEHLRALAAHANYLKRVRACLAEGVACDCHKAHDQCDFGRWWYAEIFPRRSQFSAQAQALIATIDELHRAFHESSAKIAELSAQGDLAAARRYETELMQRPNQLIQAILQMDDAGFSDKS